MGSSRNASWNAVSAGRNTRAGKNAEPKESDISPEFIVSLIPGKGSALNAALRGFPRNTPGILLYMCRGTTKP